MGRDCKGNFRIEMGSEVRPRAGGGVAVVDDYEHHRHQNPINSLILIRRNDLTTSDGKILGDCGALVIGPASRFVVPRVDGDNWTGRAGRSPAYHRDARRVGMKHGGNRYVSDH